MYICVDEAEGVVGRECERADYGQDQSMQAVRIFRSIVEASG